MIPLSDTTFRTRLSTGAAIENALALRVGCHDGLAVVFCRFPIGVGIGIGIGIERKR